MTAASLLVMTRPSSERTSIRAIPSRSVSPSRRPDSSAMRAADGPPVSRSVRRSVPLTMSSTSDASRDTTPVSVADLRCADATATSALAVTPTRTRTTPKTSASSMGRRRWPPDSRASNIAAARYAARSGGSIGPLPLAYHARGGGSRAVRAESSGDGTPGYFSSPRDPRGRPSSDARIRLPAGT